MTVDGDLGCLGKAAGLPLHLGRPEPAVEISCQVQIQLGATAVVHVINSMRSTNLRPRLVDATAQSCAHEHALSFSKHGVQVERIWTRPLGHDARGSAAGTPHISVSRRPNIQLPSTLPARGETWMVKAASETSPKTFLKRRLPASDKPPSCTYLYHLGALS